MKLLTIINDYLNDATITSRITGGDNEPGAENDIFISRLEKNSTFNNRLIITYLVILILSFFLLCALIWYFLPDKIIISALLGGEGLSIIFVIKAIHRLYKDKIFTDHLLYLIPKLKSESDIKMYIESLSSFLK